MSWTPKYDLPCSHKSLIAWVLQEIRDEHSLQVGHAAAVVSAGPTETPPGYAAEAAMSAGGHGAHVVVRLMVVRGATECGRGSRTTGGRGHQRVDRQHRGEPWPGPTRRGRSGR